VSLHLADSLCHRGGEGGSLFRHPRPLFFGLAVRTKSTAPRQSASATHMRAARGRALARDKLGQTFVRVHVRARVGLRAVEAHGLGSVRPSRTSEAVRWGRSDRKDYLKFNLRDGVWQETGVHISRIAWRARLGAPVLIFVGLSLIIRFVHWAWVTP
jgi:hypothetical protein